MTASPTADGGCSPSWDDLRAFLEVARASSFTQAATRLHTSQSTVTRQVQRLERQLSRVLVVRTRRNVHLTLEGRELQRWVEQMDEGARRGVLACTRALPAVAHVATFSHALGHLVTELEAAGPDVDWRVTRLEPAEALRALERDELHAAVCYPAAIGGLPENEPLPAHVRVRRLAHEPIWVALPTDHPLAARTDITPLDLAADTWIAAPRGPLREMLEVMALAAGFEPDIRHVTQDPAAVEALLQEGRAVSLCAPTNRSCEAYVTRPLVDGPARWIYLAWREDRLRDRAVEVVLTGARRWYRRRAADNPEYLARLDGDAVLHESSPA